MGKSQDEFNAAYNDIRNRMKKGVGAHEGGIEKGEVFWAVIEASAALIDGILGGKNIVSGPVSALASGGGRLIYDGVTGRKQPDAVPNPWFVWNGHDDLETSYTRQYLKNRFYKGLAGAGIGLAGAAVSFVSQVDVGGIVQHGNAVGSTAVHLHKFKAIAESYKETRTISNWLNLIIKMKVLKAGIRGAGLVGSSIPVPAVGAVTGVIAAGVKLGVKLTLTRVCLATSADLHWRGFQELTLSRTFGGEGPAMRILRELFQRRGATRVFGQYDVEKIIREPNGWMAVQDKLMLI